MGSRRPRKPWSVTRWVLTVTVVMSLVAAIALAVTLNSIRTSRERGTEIVRATRGTQAQTVSLSGTIQPQNQAQLAFKVPGTIESVDVKVGDRVQAGQRLATVDSRDLSDAVTLARANLSAARAQLSTTRGTSGARRAQIDAAEAQVRSAEASLSSAQNRLADATLRATIAGTVARVDYDRGDEVAGTGGISIPSGTSGLDPSGMGGLSGLPGSNPGAPSGTASGITIVATGAWKLDATVGTADLPMLKKGQAARVTPTGTSTTVAGTVDTVGIVASQTSGGTATFPLTITVTEGSDQLFAGSSADAVVTVGTFPDVLTIPVAAVTTADNGTSTVQKVSGGEAQTTTVQLGRRFGANVEILAGLAEGDEVRLTSGLVISQAPVNPFAPTPRATR